MNEHEGIKKSGTSTEVEIHPDVAQAGVIPHHEESDLESVHSALAEIGVKPAGDVIPVQTTYEGLVQIPEVTEKTAIGTNAPIESAARWLLTLKRKLLERKDVGFQKSGSPSEA